MIQESEYLVEILKAFESDTGTLSAPVVAVVIRALNERGFVVMKDSEFNQLQNAWARVGQLEMEAQQRSSITGGPSEGTVTVRGR